MARVREQAKMKKPPVAPSVIFAWGLIIATSTLAVPFLYKSQHHPYLFLACVAIASGSYLRTLCFLDRAGAESRRALALCLALAALWRVPLVLMPPIFSSDVYRYVWDGRIQRLGYNPYLLVPSDPAHHELHTAETLLMNHLDLPTPYPAGAELFFRAVMTVHGSARAMKSAITICDGATAAILLLWLGSSDRNAWWVLAYAWNPLVSLEGAGSGHIDLLGALCLIVAAFMLSRGRRTIAALALAFGVAVKFLPVVLVPLFWRRVRIRDVALALVLLILLYLLFLGPHGLPMGSVITYLSLWRINGPLYRALGSILPNAVLLPLPVALGLAVAAWAGRRWAPDSPETWAWPAAVALLFAPTVFPWYLLWLTPFLFSTSTLPLAVWSVSVLTIYSKLPGWAVGVVEYGPVATSIAWVMVRRSELATTNL